MQFVNLNYSKSFSKKKKKNPQNNELFVDSVKWYDYIPN